MKSDDLPNVVSNRNHFVAIEDYADLLIRSPRSGFTEEHRPEVMRFLASMVHEIANALQTGAERGMAQAEHLILDHGYYEARNSRRERSRKSEASRQELEETNRQRRRENPTSAEIQESMRQIEANIKYHSDALEKCRGQIRWIQSRPSFLMSSGSDRPNA